jgi:LacI family transcriptional regulator, galactose operon repressor
VLALQQLSLSGTVALVGFDDVAIGEFVQPRITVIRQDTHTIGAKAFDRLLARLDGSHTPASIEVVPTTLVKRGSGEIRAPRRSAKPRRTVSR